MEKIIDTTTTMEEILDKTQLSPNHGRGFLGKNSDFGKPVEEVGQVLQRLNKFEWKETEKTDPLSSALIWHKRRINTGHIEQVMSYKDAKKLFAEFWTDYIPKGDNFFVHPQNVSSVENILKWAIGDPESTIPLHKSIWLWGNVGAGKSIFATALYDLFEYLHLDPNNLKFNGKPWDFIDMNALYLDAKYDITEFKVLNTKSCLILDELKEAHFLYKHYGNDIKIIGDLISGRYSLWQKANVRTLITTNLSPTSEQLLSILDDREIDRVLEMFKSIQWHGKSLRKN